MIAPLAPDDPEAPCPRFRVVTLEGTPYYLFWDAMFRADRVLSVESRDPAAGPEGDARAVVEVRASGPGRTTWEVLYFQPNDYPGDDPGVLMGFRLERSAFGARLSFASGSVPLKDVVAVVRLLDTAEVWRHGFGSSERFGCRAYPWARPK